eukprot:3803654-Pyramimonas_sp.AAC.1
MRPGHSCLLVLDPSIQGRPLQPRSRIARLDDQVARRLVRPLGAKLGVEIIIHGNGSGWSSKFRDHSFLCGCMQPAASRPDSTIPTLAPSTGAGGRPARQPPRRWSGDRSPSR